MHIPLVDLKAQHATIKDEILAVVDHVFESQEFILGQQVAALERAVAAYCGVEYAVGVSSGTDALLASLMALGIGQGDHVVVPANTFFATAGAVARLGAVPVFVDVEPATSTMDPSDLRRRLDAMPRPQQARLRAIIPVHLYGQVCDMAAILETAQAYDVPVIEDAAQAIGAQYHDGRSAGSMGLVGCLSFFPSKNLGAAGDAGMILTRDPALASTLRLYRVHGADGRYDHCVIGGNFRLDALQAAIILVKLRHLDRWTQARQERADTYSRMLHEGGLVKRGVVEPPEARYRPSGVPRYHAYHLYVIRARRRDALQRRLREAGIDTRTYYPIPLHLQPCFKELGYREGEMPEAERAARETLALPIYPELTKSQQTYVVEQVVRFYEDAGYD